MVDRVSAFITIGGKLSPEYLPEFLELIEQEELSLEWDGAPFELSQFIPGKSLCLMAHEVALGQFTQLEDFCFARSLPFRRWCDGCRSWMPQRAVFDGSADVVYIDTDGGDRALLSRATVTDLETFDSIVAWLDAADFEVPVLEIGGAIEGTGPAPVTDHDADHDAEAKSKKAAWCLLRVVATARLKDLDIEDRDVPGLYVVGLDQADIDQRQQEEEPIIAAAKDVFHACIAIANLDDFSIDIEIVADVSQMSDEACWLTVADAVLPK